MMCGGGWGLKLWKVGVVGVEDVKCLWVVTGEVENVYGGMMLRSVWWFNDKCIELLVECCGMIMGVVFYVWEGMCEM